MTTIIAFILILGLLIFVHEFGHFIMAKRAGIKIEEFGFGYPPRIFSVRIGETIYSLNLFPVGGFVKIYGEEGKEKDEKPEDKKRAFYNKPLRTRAKILFAGVAMNLILAMVLLGLGYNLGLPKVIEDNEAGVLNEPKVQIAEVALKSPAQEAGIMIGDTIKEIKSDEQTLTADTVAGVVDFVRQRKGKEIGLLIQRGSESFEKKILARQEFPEDQGPLGIALVRTAIVSYPWYQAIFKGIINTFALTWTIILAFGSILWGLVTTGKLTVDIAGPVGIFSITGQAAKLGFVYLLQFTAIFTINLFIINLIPFPPLDGGRLLFLLIEKFKGKPVDQKVERTVQTIGFALLILLLIAVTWRDIARLI